ncbi:MAG TPA: substrate-binding domain-containing protein [Geobacteraceae bacterium]
MMTALILVLFSVLSGCASSEKIIRIGGGDAALTGFIAPVKETFEEENGIPLVVVQSKPGNELVDLKTGSVDAIVSAVPVDELIKEAANSNFVVNRRELHEVQIGKNQTVIFLNRGIKIRKLTKTQLKGIFTGKIANWKKVGGPNRHIVVVWNPGGVQENERFVREVLQGAPIVSSFHGASSSEEVRTKVMGTPGAIGIGPSALIAPVVRVPKSPLMASAVVFVTNGEPSPRVQKLIDLLKDVEFMP